MLRNKFCSAMRVFHTIGDSHASATHSVWTFAPKHAKLATHHLGPKIMHSFARTPHDFCNFICMDVHDNDWVCFCFGEIDVRCHIAKFITETLSFQSIIDALIEGYMTGIETVAGRVKNVNICVLMIPPPVRSASLYRPDTPEEFIIRGTDADRLAFTTYFNSQLSQACKRFGYHFIYAYNDYADADGFLLRSASDGCCHMRISNPIAKIVNHLLSKHVELVKIINLDSRPQRFTDTVQVAKRLMPGATIERFAGIVPTADEAAALGISGSTLLWGGLGALGCYLSHKSLYEECVARALPAILILEDDAQDYSFGPEVLTAAMAELPPGWLMLYLTIHPRHGRSAYEQVSPHLVRPSHGTTTSAYIISLKGAKKILKQINARPIIEIDTALETMLPSPDIYACTPFVSSQRNGDVSTIEGRFTSFNCGAPYYVEASEDRIVVDCRACTTWSENLQLLAQVLHWQKTYAPSALYPVCLINDSMPASFPFAKVYKGTPTLFEPPLSECDPVFARSVLDVICGGNTVPADVANKTVSWEPHTTLPYLTGPGAITVPIKPTQETFAALWLASKSELLIMNGNLTPLFLSVCNLKITELPQLPPTKFLNEFTMQGKIPVFQWFFDNRVTGPQITYDVDATEEIIAVNRQGQKSCDPYGARDVLYNILENNVSCVGKDVAVIGTNVPWIEGALLQRGCKSVTTVEYNVLQIDPIVSKTFRWTSVHYSEFSASSQLFDLIITFSSVEHDGLGRYGDPINPNADLEAMEVIRRKLAPGGSVLWGAPVAADALVWNAHRIYGPVRLPLLLRGFRAAAWITHFTYLQMPAQPHAHQPWILLSKVEPDADPACEFDLVHASILSCPKY